MALRPITEQQFRTRRKDRRMVWVDAVAVLVGMVMLLATVGGVVFVEPEPTPLEWDYSFFEETRKHKHCAGITGVNEGCTQVITPKRTQEGETVKTIFAPIDWPNVTSVRFTLSWVDDYPITDPADCKPDRGDDCTYVYDNQSTDILRLEVTPPSGEPESVEAANDVDTKFGSIGLVWDFLEMPSGGSVHAFSSEEANAEVVPRFTDDTHLASGEWQAAVTLVRAGDQEGTIPINPCEDAFGEAGQEAPGEVSDDCETYTHRKTLRESQAFPLIQAVPGGVYVSSYEDAGQGWLLEMAIRSYASQVNIR